jgi:RNA polymerase sigma factor (sigma-70 family)
MRDNQIVAAIAARDLSGVAEAYDKYAPGLYGYCRSLLREPTDAADAVQDTFVIAAAKVTELRDPSRLRPWLYAVARNECHRRLRGGNAPAMVEEPAHVLDESAEVSHQAEQAQLRKLVRAAISGLSPADQEIVQLSARYELQGTDLADVLGVSRHHAQPLLARARGQLSDALGALLLARAGRQSCAALDELLRDWDGTMTVLMRKRICAHIEGCELCGERKRLELRPAMLRGLAPPALLPAGLRVQVLGLCADRKREALIQRTDIVDRAGGFGGNGFPAALARPRTLISRPSRGRVAMAAGAATVAAAVIATATVLATAGPPGRHAGGQSAAGPSSPGGSHGRVAQPSPSGARASAPPLPVTARGTLPSGAARSGREPAAALGIGARSSSGGTSGSGGAGGTGTGGISPVSVGVGTGGSGGGGSGTPTVSVPTITVPTISVTPGVLVLASLLGGPATGTLTLTAGNAPVTHYAISVPSSLLGELSVSPASGSIGAGQSVRVTVTLSGLLAVDTTITANPGSHSVTVLLGAGL